MLCETSERQAPDAMEIFSDQGLLPRAVIDEDLGATVGDRPGVTRLSLARAAAAGTGLVVDAAGGQGLAEGVGGRSDRTKADGEGRGCGRPAGCWASRTSGRARGRRAPSGCQREHQPDPLGSTQDAQRPQDPHQDVDQRVVRVVSVTSAASSTSAQDADDPDGPLPAVRTHWKTASSTSIQPEADLSQQHAPRQAGHGVQRKRRAEGSATCHGGPAEPSADAGATSRRASPRRGPVQQRGAGRKRDGHAISRR